jgi:hypothetical protein
MRITSGEDHVMKKDPASSVNNGSIDLRLPPIETIKIVKSKKKERSNRILFL